MSHGLICKRHPAGHRRDGYRFCKPTSRFHKKSAASALACALLAGASAFAGDITWTGSVNNLWNTTDANWAGDSTTFANGDNVLFSDTSGEITAIVSRSPGSTVVTSDNKVTFATGIMGTSKPIGGPSILTGTLVKNGGGELELGDPLLGQQFGSDRNQYSNSFTSVTVNGGTLRIRSRAALGTGLVTLAGGTKFIQASEEARFGFGNEQIDNNFHLSGGMAEFPLAFGNDNKGVWIRNGTISGPGGILVTGSSRTLAISAANTFEGGVTIQDAGNLTFGSYQSLGSGIVTASLDAAESGGLSCGSNLPGNTASPGGVMNDIVITSGKFLNIRTTDPSATLRLGGGISGDGSLCKFGNDGVVIISGANSYSGGTLANDGTLVCEGLGSLGQGPLTIAAGARIRLEFIGSRSVPTLKLDGALVPDGTYGSSDSPAENQDDVHFSGPGMVTVGTPKAATTIALAQTGGSNPSDITAPVTLTATVSGGTASGIVSFYDGLTFLGSDPLDGTLQASVTTTALPAGVRALVAQYEGDATYASSVSPPLGITVTDGRPASGTVVALTGGANPSSPGNPLTFTATVTGASPTGQVTFHDRGNVIGSGALNGVFEASVTTATLPPGTRTITAEYAGDANNKPSAGAYDQVVNPPAGNGKLKVFILAGQSNMQGHGRVDSGRDPEDSSLLIAGGIGSLRRATVREPKKFGFLVNPSYPLDSKGWATRDDVWVSFWDFPNGGVNGPTVQRRNGILDSGFGVGASLNDGRIGPEYGFGHAVGSGLADEVLIIKTAWGGKSLYVDFRPPSSGGTTGPFYLDMVEKVHLTLDNLTTYYPGYDGNGYELAGFGWHQGWNDRGNPSAVAEYEANLANLIRDIRTEFGVPGLPFVIANSGLADAPSGPGSLIEAQGNVSDPDLYPEFAGKVITVDTRPFDYGVFNSPINQGFHWNGNGESYFNIGTEMGEAMLSLQVVPPTAFEIWAGDAAQGLTEGVDDGLTDDPDFDGIINLLEFVLGGNPIDADSGILPTGVAPSGGNWLFEYDRNKLSTPGVTQIVQYTTDFAGWTDVPIPAASAGIVTVTPGIGTDRISVAIPVSGTSGFARLKVSQ